MDPRRLLKPEYLFRPSQIGRRLAVALQPKSTSPKTVTLPWGLPFSVRPGETIGEAIIHLGVFDLTVCETLWRLTEPGEVSLDAGANIGLMSSILAVRSGPKGLVYAVEPHPGIAQELRDNVLRWPKTMAAEVQVVEGALTAKEETLFLRTLDSFATNRGTSQVQKAATETTVVGLPLDRLIPPGTRLGVAKVDVEGHEEALLNGATRLLTNQWVRDWVIEHHGGYPSAVTSLFERAGYALFQIRRGFFCPNLTPIQEGLRSSRWESTNLLATTDPSKALQKLAAWGWQCLR